MSDTKRTEMIILRHAKPVVDQDPKSPTYNRSLDILTEQGAKDSIEFGKKYSGHEGEVLIYFSNWIRANHTAANINIGIGKVAKEYGEVTDLGLEYTKTSKQPYGIPYGKEFIEAMLMDNPRIECRIGEEVNNAITSRYGISKKYENPLIVLVSHGPKVEISAGMLLGLPVNEIGSLAAGPLDGFVLKIDTKKESGNISEVKLSYKGGPEVPVKNFLFDR